MNFFGDDYCEVKIAAKPSRCNSWSWYGYRCARECGTCVYIATPEPPPSPASPPSPQSPPGSPPPPVDPPWEYYLQGSAAGFAARSIHLWQFVLSPAGLPDDFEG